MADLDPSGPNAEQIRFWNEQAGPQWVAGADRLDALLSHLGEIAMERARLPAGARVLDVGCGCGDTSLTLARRVGPAGRVLGIDISGVMLERARERAHAAAVSHVAFTQADAQTHTFPRAEFDAVFSRFGVMFFADPTAAFANLGGALRAGGQVTFVCWRPLAENPWILVPLMAAAAHVTLPPPPAPGTPGPFSLGDADRVRDILQQAGFVEVVCESLDSAMTFSTAGGLDQTVAFALEDLGPLARALREASPDVRPRVAAAVRAALEPHVGPEGVRLPAAVWIVSARRP